VAEERTANDTAVGSSYDSVSFSKAVRMSASSRSGNGVSRTFARMSRPAAARAVTSSASRSARVRKMWSRTPDSSRKVWNASEVVAKPSGTFTPALDRFWISSPSDAFLPPTRSMSSARPR
jgi:hypothetical protein